MAIDSRLDRIERSIRELLERIERLESMTGASSGVKPTDESERDTPSRDDRVDQPTHPTVPTVGSAADEATPTVPSAASVLAPTPTPSDTTSTDHPPTHPAPPPPPESSAARSSRPNVEQVIGTRIAAIAGGLLVAMAAAFFAKLAYDRGWIGAIPPIVRALLLAVAGAGFIALAEALRRRLGRPASIGLALAGLGTLYVDGWAIGSVLDLVPPAGAMVAMAITTLVGLVVTARFGSRVLGATSLVAGGLAPYLVGGEPSVLAPGLYFTALLVVAMGASIVRPHPFVSLRAATLAVVGATAIPWWVGALDAGESTIVLLVSMAWWGVVHAAGLVAGHRGLDWKVGTVLNLATTVLIAIPVPIRVSSLGGGPGILAVEGWTVLGFAAASIAMAFQFGPGLGALTSPAADLARRDRCGHRLAETAWLEGAVLLMLAAALLLRGAALPIAWVGIALGVMVFAARRGSRRAAVFAGVATVLAQGAGSFMVMRGLAPPYPTILDGTPFRVAAIGDLWIVAATGAGTVATAIWWPAAADGRRSPFGPATLLAFGILPWLVPAAMLGAPGWWTLLVATPVVAAGLVTRRRSDRAGWRTGIVWAVIALIPMTASLALPVVATFDGTRGIPDWAADVRVFMRDWGGPWITTLGLAATQIVFLAAIAGIGRTARIGIDEIDARARASMRLLPVAAVPLGAALLMVGVPATRVGWSSWIGPPMVGAAGATAILMLLILLRWSGSLPASTRWAAVLATLSASVWIAASITSAVVADLGPAAPPPIVNVRGFTGLAVLGFLIVVFKAVRLLDPKSVPVVGFTAGVLGVVLGSVLVQDLAGRGTLGADSGISIWWAVYAIGLIVAGFRRHLGLLRKIGLGLLALTAIKFLAVDLRNAETIHRIVSALGVGLLMVLTSVIYVRAFGTPSARAGDQDAFGESR